MYDVYEVTAQIVLMMFCAATSLIVFFAASFTASRDILETRIFSGLLLLCFLMDLLFGITRFFIDEPDGAPYIFTSILMFAAYFGLIAMVSFYITEHIRQFHECSPLTEKLNVVFCFLGWVIWSISMFNHMFSMPTELDDPHFLRFILFQLLGEACGYIPFLSQMLLIWIHRHHVPHWDLIFLYMIYLFPLIGVLIREFVRLPMLEAGITLSLLTTYLMLQTTTNRNYEKQLYNMKLWNLQSRIQPHFTSNVLNTIYDLCEFDPKKAQEAIENFSDYLRKNLKNTDGVQMIPLTEELDHIENYLNIEMLRFESILYDYDLQAKDFMVPALSIEPLVENAVKHAYRNEGLWIHICATEDEKNYHISIEDNGKGFDPSSESNNTAEHYGISSVRTRLSMICNGTLDISSEPDKGTVVTITIPKGDRT